MPREREHKFNSTSALSGGGHNPQLVMAPNFDYIKQNGKIILSSNDNSSILMIFRNLIGLNIKGEQYIQYLQNIVFAEMGFNPGRIEYWRNDKLISVGTIPNINQ